MKILLDCLKAPFNILLIGAVLTYHILNKKKEDEV